MSENNRSVFVRAPRWGKFIAVLQTIVTYTADYFTGQKHKHTPGRNREKQK